MANGLGPWWFPSKLRNILTKLSMRFFDEAAWNKHDEGYELAIHSRSYCDLRFLQAMLRDASKTKTAWKTLTCLFLAVLFWFLVRIFGHWSYNVKKKIQGDDMNFQGTGKRLKSGDIGRAAKEIGIETAVLLAFLEVEAAGRGFDNQNRVKILPEAHIFYRNLKGVLRSSAVSMGIAYAKWKPNGYNFNKYERFKAMIDLNAVATYLSTSYGLGQIMGFNHKAAGHSTAQQMFETAQQGEFEQLVQLVTLLKSWGMASMLSNGDFTNPNAWRKPAKKYNGGGYAKHGYHVKLARAYVKHSGHADFASKKVSKLLKRGSKSEAVRNLQTDLQTLGYEFNAGIDGRFGNETHDIVTHYQKNNSLEADGWAGVDTLEKIKNQIQQLEVDKSPELPVFDKKTGWGSIIATIMQGIFK